MKKLLLLPAIAAAAVALSVGSAGAVTGNYTQDFVHNYVGLVAFYNSSGNFVWRCTGSLLNSTTFLTAGHCTDTAGGAASAIVWVSQEGGHQYSPPAVLEDPLTGYPNECLNSSMYPCSTAHTLREYGYSGLKKFGSDNKDVGMVILDHPIAFDHYASLASAGSVDALHQGTPFTITGYGVSGEKPGVVSFRERLMATSLLINTNNTPSGGTNLQLSTNPGDGKGGTCFGDSGGPILYGSTDIVVGVNSFVLNGQCAGVSFAYRTDQAAVLSWIQANADGPVNVVSLP